MPKTLIDIHLSKHIGRTIGYCGHCPNPIVAYNTYWWPRSRAIVPRDTYRSSKLPTIVGSITYWMGYYRGYKKELNGTQTGRSKTLQAWASHYLVETIHLKLLRAQQGQTAPYLGIFRWSGGACGVDDEWRTRVDCTEKGCLRAPLLSNTEAMKWRKVYVPIPIIRNNRMVKGLSIPIVRNNSCERSITTYFPKQYVWWKVYLYLSLEAIGFVSQPQ